MSKKIRTSNLTDETYYRMSQRAYNYDYLKRKLEKNDFIRINSSISKPTYWYVDQIKSENDTGLDAVVLVQAVKNNGNWIKSKTPKTWSSPLREPISQKARSMTARILFSEMIREKKYIIL